MKKRWNGYKSVGVVERKVGEEGSRNYVKSLENLSEHFLKSAFARLAYYFYAISISEGLG